MGVQVVFDQYTALGVWKMLMNQFVDAGCPIHFGAPLGDFDLSLISNGAKNMNRFGGSLAAIFVIIAFWMPLFDRNALAWSR